jgi:hypothetical protein
MSESVRNCPAFPQETGYCHHPEDRYSEVAGHIAYRKQQPLEPAIYVNYSEVAGHIAYRKQQPLQSQLFM